MNSKLDEVLALIESASDGDYLRRIERGTNIALQCAEYLRENGPALRTLLAEHEALLLRVADAPVREVIAHHVQGRDMEAIGFKWDEKPLPSLIGQIVRILAEPGEVAEA